MNGSVAMPNSTGPGKRIPDRRPNAQAATGSASSPRAVTSLKATPYGSTTSSATMSRLGSGK